MLRPIYNAIMDFYKNPCYTVMYIEDVYNNQIILQTPDLAKLNHQMIDIIMTKIEALDFEDFRLVIDFDRKPPIEFSTYYRSGPSAKQDRSQMISFRKNYQLKETIDKIKFKSILNRYLNENQKHVPPKDTPQTQIYLCYNPGEEFLFETWSWMIYCRDIN